MTRHLKPIVALCVITLGACADLTKPDQFGNAYDIENFGKQLGATYPEGGYTYAVSNPDHGIRITYYDRNGRNYLWDPSIKIISMPGSWRATAAEICHAYDIEYFNPVTQQGSEDGEEQCGKTDVFGKVISRVEGDPFDLKSRSIPDFDLTQCRLPEPMKLLTSDWEFEPQEEQPPLFMDEFIKENAKVLGPERQFIMTALTASSKLFELYKGHYNCLDERASEVVDLTAEPKTITNARVNALLEACVNEANTAREKISQHLARIDNEYLSLYKRHADRMDRAMATAAIAVYIAGV